MKSRLILGLTLLLETGASAGHAAPLTWKDAAKIAAVRNPSLAAARREEKAALARRRGSFNGYLPQVSLNQTYTDGDRAAASSRWGASANASLDVFNLGNAYAARSARAGLDAAAAQRLQASVDLRFNLYSAFAGLLFAQEQAAVAQKILNIRRGNAQMVDLMYKSGREYKGNAMQAQAALLQAEAGLDQSRRNLRAAQSALNAQLGRENFDEISVEGTLEAPPPPGPDGAARAENLPFVISARAQATRARAEFEKTRSTFFPVLSANYSRSLQGADYFPDGPHWSASGILSWPLFGNGLTSSYYNTAAARQEFHKQEENYRAALYRARQTLESARSNLAEAADQFRVQKKFLEAARQQNDEAAVRYNSGLMTYENWVVIVNNLVNLETGVLSAERDAAVAGAAWAHALGTPLEEQ